MKKISQFLIIEKDNNNIYTIRITPELQDDLGTIGYAKIFEKDKVEKGEVIMKVEASKAIVDIKMPIGGTIVEVNKATKTEPNILNSIEDKDNWIVRLKDVNEKEFLELEDY